MPRAPEHGHPPDLGHPDEPGHWTELQRHVDKAMWQQEDADPVGKTDIRFWIVNPPERLMFDTFEEAEAMFEALSESMSPET